MNCRPGDLAIVIRAEVRPQALGAIVRVLRAYDGGFWGEQPAWWVEWRGDGDFHTADANLRPLRDPGDAAADEARRRISDPRKEFA